MAKKISWCVLLMASIAATSVGCASIDQAVDCNAICTRYRDCFDEAYDVDACENRCQDMIDSDPHGADDCEACIDDRSCTEAIFPCSAECSSIVP
ncbi:MAG: hypothetical protein IPK60_16310 [Sandaracinaceae bacterium]|nr:hypothetical protein [Sandaracinaceae bacterium]